VNGTGTDDERCWRAVQSKDARFDGWFVTAVVTTGIYCRPSCPALVPRRHNARFLPTAAAAQAAGFRACRRCRPDASPGSPDWDTRSDLVARAVRLIADGVVDREGVPGLADRLGYSRRQVERAVAAELGAGPLALARAQRAQTARTLLETTALPVADVALAAGFGSVRQFNDTVREVFAGTPSQLRAAGRRSLTGTPGSLVVRLPFRGPLWPDNVFGHLAATAVPGVEEWRDGAYRRSVRLPHGPGVVALEPPSATGDAGHVVCRLALHDLRDVPAAVARCRRLLDLDADPVAVDALLAEDPVLAPLVAKAPGRRVPRTVDEGELALRAVLGQQVSTAAARTAAARLVLAAGEPLSDPGGGLTHLFPTPEAVAAVDPAVLAMPATRRQTVLRLARALADGEVDLDPGCDRETARAVLLALPGIGPWTVETVAMRALGDPDAFLPTDLGVRASARTLGLDDLPARSARWSPWRAYAVQHLWAVGDHAVNRLPALPGLPGLPALPAPRALPVPSALPATPPGGAA
jgi:AraC family transcriptional regulator, regulatory protein of adaptative response / DNA-3-methyladenine glycosylase II